MAADQAQQVMALQAMMANLAQQQQQGAAQGAGNNPQANMMAAMAAMMQQQQQSSSNAQNAPNDLQLRQQMMQMFMKKAAAAAAASGAEGGGQHGASSQQDACCSKSGGGSGSGHGHSHGHGHGHGMAMNEKALAEHQMMMAMHQQMSYMQKQHKQTNNKGYILQHPEASQGPRESYLYGGGHYTPPIFGWGNLAKNYVDPQELTEAEGGVKKPQENLQSKLQQMMEGRNAGLKNIWLFTLPLLGRLRVVKDPMGLVQSSFIFIYWLYGNFTTWNFVLLPQYAEGHINLIPLLIYAIVSALTIISFFRAATTSPGFTPDPLFSDVDDEWTFCEACQQKRPPKAHHCRRCGQCVPMMDHHCPWINNCVGQNNQWLFMQLVFYATLISFLTLTFDLLFKFYFPECKSCDPSSFFQLHQHAFVNGGIVMAVFMLLSGGGLFCTQHTNVLFNSFLIRNSNIFINIGIGSAGIMMIVTYALSYAQHRIITAGTTTVEWMKLQREAALSGKPMDWASLPKPVKSMREAYRNVCGTNALFTWPFPCRKRNAPIVTPKQSSV